MLPSRLITLVLLCALAICAPLRAQNDNGKPATDSGDTPTAAAQSATNGEPRPPAEVPEQYNSPHATMRTFLDAMNRANDPALSSNEREESRTEALDALDLSDVSDELAWKLAERLLLVFNRLGEYRSWLPWKYELEGQNDVERVTYFPSPRFRDILNKQPNVQPIGRIELVKQDDGRWQFSAATLAGMDELYISMEKLPVLVGLDEEQLGGTHWIRRQMPESLRGVQYFGLELWQWLGLLVIIMLGIVLDHIVRAILRTITNRILKRQDAKAQTQTITGVVRPIGLVAAAFLWLYLTTLLDLPSTAYFVLMAAVRIFTVLAVTWTAWRMIDLLAEVLESKAERTSTKFDDVLVPLLRKTLKVFVVAFGLVYAANALAINIWPLLTGLGIGGLAFAFAAKDTIENFFGSIATILDRPFEIGDWVVIHSGGGDTEGIVETVGFRSTRIRTFYNSQVTVPNANLVRANVDNYGRRKYRRWKTTIGVQYDTTPDQLLAFTEGIRELVRCHPFTRKDYFQVWVTGFGSSSIDIMIYIFHEVDDWSMELRERERLIVDMVRLADQLGVQFAFPTQTVHLFKEEHKPHEVEHETPQSMSDRRAMVHGIRAAQQLVRDQPWQNDKPGPVKFPEGPTVINEDDAEQAAIEDRTAGG